MKAICRFIIFLLLSVKVYYSLAQSPTKGNYQIKGEVIDKTTQNPVEFATVSMFLEKDSSLISGAITNNKGKFIVNKLIEGRYYVKIEFIGYKTKIISKVLVGLKEPEVNLGLIEFSQATELLKEFEIVKEKSIIETKIDKKVYNVSKDIGNEGKTGLEMLENMPSIDVDEEDNISLRGDNSVRILLNGRPTAMNLSDLLKQLPASAIEKVEVITNPSAKYNPEGMSGIINIVLKKEDAAGFNGSINTAYTFSILNSTRGGLSLNFRKNKINVYTNLGVYKGGHFYSGKTQRYYSFADTSYAQTMIDDGGFNSFNLWYSGGIDYFINAKNTIFLEGSGWMGNGDNYDDNNYDFYDNTEVLAYSSKRYANGVSDNNGNSISTGWQKTFNKDDHTLDLTLNYSTDKSNKDREITETFTANGSTILPPDSLQNTYENETGYDFDSRIDYVLPFNDSTKVELGLRMSLNESSTDFQSTSYKTNLNTFLNDSNISNIFEYKQQVDAFYITFSKQYQKLGVKLASRIENTTVKGVLINTNETFTNNYFSIFPTIHFSYKIKEANELLLSYSRRINRPRSWHVNPFASYSDPYNLRQGNPAILPEFIDVIELSYLKYWKKFNINPAIYYRKVNDKIQRVTYLNSENVLVSTRDNIAEADIIGGEFNIGYNPYKWWRMRSSFDYFTEKVSNPNTIGNVNTVTERWSFHFSSTQTIKKQWMAQLTLKYRGKSASYQGTRYPRYGVNVSISKSMLNKKARLTVGVRDLFNTNRFKYESNDLGNSSFTTDRRWQSQSLTVSFNYAFGKVAKNKKRRKAKGSNSNDNFNTDEGDGR